VIEHRAGLEPYAKNDEKRDAHDGGQDERLLGQHVAALILRVVDVPDQVHVVTLPAP
jgi:hypothetical protein